MIRQPGLRRYVVIPLLINVVIFSVTLGYGIVYFDQWVTETVASLPAWLSFLSRVLWILFALIAVAFLLFGFTIVANIIAAPFNAVLAVKVEGRVRKGESGAPQISWIMVVPRAIGRELSKLIYYLPRLAGLILLTLIPGLNLLASPLWILFGAWMMAIQYADYGADNNGVSFTSLRDKLGATRMSALGFGLIVYFMMLIPVLNLIVIPAAVAGGTVFYVRRLHGSGNGP